MTQPVGQASRCLRGCRSRYCPGVSSSLCRGDHHVGRRALTPPNVAQQRDNPAARPHGNRKWPVAAAARQQTSARRADPRQIWARSDRPAATYLTQLSPAATGGGETRPEPLRCRHGPRRYRVRLSMAPPYRAGIAVDPNREPMRPMCRARVHPDKRFRNHLRKRNPAESSGNQRIGPAAYDAGRGSPTSRPPPIVPPARQAVDLGVIDRPRRAR